MGTFPIINNVEKYVVTYTNEFYQAINTTVAILYKMPLARQNIINYVIFKPGANKVENADFRGIYKSLLFKRMESSVASFKRTVERGLSGIEEIKKSITDSTIDFGGTKYSFYNQNIFLLDLDKDAVGFTQILELWNEITDESKTDVLVEMLSETKGKTIVFTEYKDTFDEIRSVLGNKALYYDSSTPDAVLDTVRTEFDNNVPVSEQTNKYNILVCTDVLSEGVNMHRADNVVHFDNKWNPSKITQRNGRVDRITINSSKIKEINIFTFGVDSSIESIIELQNKIDDKTYWGDLFKTISYNDCDYRFERYRDGYTLSVAQDGTGVRISKVVRTPKYDFIYSDSSFIIGHQVPIVFSSKKKFESSDIHGYINDPIIDYAPASRRSDYTHMVLREGKLLKEPIRNYLLNSLYSGIYEAIIKEYLEKDKNIFKNVIEYITDLNQKYSTIVKPENYMGIAYTENGLVYTHHVLESI